MEAGRRLKREGNTFVNLWYRELLVLSWRMFIILRRTPALYLLRLTLVGLTGLLCACLFWRPPENFTGFQLIVAYFSFALCVLFFSSADVVPIFIQERNIFIRETSHNMYRASTYLVAATVVYIPLQVIWLPQMSVDLCSEPLAEGFVNAACLRLHCYHSRRDAALPSWVPLQAEHTL